MHITTRKRASILTFGLTLLSAIVLITAFATVGSARASTQNRGTTGFIPVHIGARVVDLRTGGPAFSMPADELEPSAVGTVEVRVVSGSSLKSRAGAQSSYARSVVLVTGATLQPMDQAAITAARTPGPAGSYGPDNAKGCSPSLSIYATCISVIGSGLTVNFWGTSAYYGKKAVCMAEFLAGGVIEEEDYFTCDGPGIFTDQYLFVPYKFEGKTQVCNYWPGAWGGKPCETVHS
jgi:hypothetical protein